jgi:hypothetical protein
MVLGVGPRALSLSSLKRLEDLETFSAAILFADSEFCVGRLRFAVCSLVLTRM